MQSTWPSPHVVTSECISHYSSIPYTAARKDRMAMRASCSSMGGMAVNMIEMLSLYRDNRIRGQSACIWGWGWRHSLTTSLRTSKPFRMVRAAARPYLGVNRRIA